jgi:hypothetical protein
MNTMAMTTPIATAMKNRIDDGCDVGEEVLFMDMAQYGKVLWAWGGGNNIRTK